MNIDDIIEAFDEHLDTYNDTVNINGYLFKPSEVLNSFALTTYLKELDRYIADNYDTSLDDSGETVYWRY